MDFVLASKPYFVLIPKIGVFNHTRYFNSFSKHKYTEFCYTFSDNA